MKNIIDELKKEIESILIDLGLRQKSGNLIGLDLGTKHFRTVKVREGVKDVPLKDTLVAETHELKDLVTRMDIGTDDRVCINFKGDALAIKNVSIPFMPHEEIEEALRWELKDQVQFNLDKAKIKFSILGEKEEGESKKIELLAVVYKEADVEAKVKEINSLGLKIKSVVPTEYALARYVDYFDLISPQETISIVDIGSVVTTIAIIGNKKLCFTRDVAIGGDSITDVMTGVLISDQGKVELSREEAERIKCEQGIPGDIKILSMMRPVLERLANQIKASLEYCEHQFKCELVRKVILAGNGSKLKGLKEYLSREIGVEIINTLPEIAVATGLALSSDTDINMLPERFKEEKGRELKRISIRLVSIVFGILFLISYGLLSVRSINLREEIKIYKSHHETMQDISLIKDKMVVLGSAVNTVSSGDIETGKIMREMSNLLPPSVILDNLVIKDTEPNLLLSGIILKGEELSEFMSGLERSPILENVKLVFSGKNEDFPQGALDFEITSDFTR